MPDLPIELSAATLPVPVQIALALAATIALLSISAWLILGRASPTVQTPSELRDVRRVRRLLLYLVPFVLVVAVIVGLLFIALESWTALNSPADSAPEDRDGDSARLNRFPGEEYQGANPYDSGAGEANGAD